MNIGMYLNMINDFGEKNRHNISKLRQTNCKTKCNLRVG